MSDTGPRISVPGIPGARPPGPSNAEVLAGLRLETMTACGSLASAALSMSMTLSMDGHAEAADQWKGAAMDLVKVGYEAFLASFGPDAPE